jgi:hypothetical protein
MRATENQLKALKIIKGKWVSGIDFAKMMWPESNMHKKSNRVINSYGLSYLFKLKRRGWLEVKNHYTFTLNKTGEELAKSQ